MKTKRTESDKILIFMKIKKAFFLGQFLEGVLGQEMIKDVKKIAWDVQYRSKVTT